MPVIQTVNIISELATKYGLQYTKILTQGQVPGQNSNPYTGQIDTESIYDSDLVLTHETSPLGTPVFTNIIFTGNTTQGKLKQGATQYKDPVTNKPFLFDDVEFQTVLLSVSQAKKIIKTEIQGRNGTVKEYIGMDDYQVTVNAIINGANYTYPQTQVMAVKNMLDAPVPIEVTCWYLNNLGIHSLVIESYQFEQEEGMYSQQKITINCISDTPALLQLNSVYA